MKYFDHNRIDRFTGGTIENALFNEKVVFNGIFYGNIIIHEPKWKELKLLIQLFKDLYLADIRIGYGKTKGYGKIRGEIKDIKIYSIQEPRIEEENLSDYGFEFTQSENIYQICLIENIYLPEKLRKYDKFLKKVDGCNYV
jgi:CRISPR/Cas system CSM-associated protein Csm3 (group 7 of RAMP superfamily)